jgi:hypothetical protein
MSYAEAPRKNNNTVAIVVGILAGMFFMLLICGGIMAALMLPALQAAREAARRMSCSNNMRQVGIALLNYESVYRSLPPAYTVDANGKPLHSWRTLILPYMDQQALYSRIDLSKPWDHPDNEVARSAVIQAYSCPSTKLPPGHTLYLAISDKKSVLAGSEAIKLSGISDGTSNTIMVYETTSQKSVHWMAPTDGDMVDFVAAVTATNPKDHVHVHGCNCVFADCSVRFLSKSTQPETLKGLATRNGNETIRLED